MLPKDIAKLVPKGHLMSESEWRSIGVQQSQGWIHYLKHDPGNCSNLLKGICGDNGRLILVNSP